MDYRWSWVRILWGDRSRSVGRSVSRTGVDNVAEIFLIYRIGNLDGTISLQRYGSGNTLTGTGVGLTHIGTQVGQSHTSELKGVVTID